MNSLPYLTRDKRVPFIFYFLVAIFVSLSVTTYIFPEALDIVRYYEHATNAARDYLNVIDYASALIGHQIDFIYSSSLFLAEKNGVHMNVLTIFYLLLYYITILEVVRKHFPFFRIPKFVLIYVAMYAPFIWVLSISRNLAAIAFFYLAINSFLDGKNIKSIFWLLVSIFTHVSMLMYIPLIFIALFLKGRKINDTFIYLSILAALLCSLIMPSQLLDIISSVMAGNETRYGEAYGNLELQSALMSDSIGYGDKLPIVFCLVFSIMLLFLNKKKDVMYWMLYLLTIMLSFFILSSLMFTNRFIMFMPIFIAYNTCKIITEGPFSSKRIVSIYSIAGCFMIFLHLYSYRTAFSL